MPAIAIAAVLSIVGSALANGAIRDNTVNTRDIKDNQVNTRDIRNDTITTRDIRDNQVNTRDIRDGSVRGVDVHPGSLGVSDLNSSTAALVGTATLLDPRAHDQDDNGDGAVDNPSGTVAGHACCLDWSQGPTELSEVAASASDPIPSATSGHGWRDVVLDPGAYVVETTAVAEGAEAGAEAAVTRLFLGGAPVGANRGYHFLPVAAAGFPASSTQTTAFEVPSGSVDQRRLLERATSIGGATKLGDDLLILRVTPR
ncbi:MAG TPA: hypothetical protein VH476_00125 [Solirubrobacterales bacterium]